MSLAMETLSLAERSRKNNDFYEHTISDTLDSHRTEGSYSDLRNFEDLIVEPKTSKTFSRRRISNRFTLLLLCVMFLLALICVIAFAFMLEVYRLDKELNKLKLGLNQCAEHKRTLDQRLDKLALILNPNLGQSTSTETSVEKRDTTNNDVADEPILPNETPNNNWDFSGVNLTSSDEIQHILPSAKPIKERTKAANIYYAEPLPPSWLDDNWLESDLPLAGSYRYENRGKEAFDYPHVGKQTRNHIPISAEVAPAWPEGSYCLLADGPCPEGFQANSASLSGIKLVSKMSTQYYSVFGYSDIYVHGRVASLRIITCCKIP